MPSDKNELYEKYGLTSNANNDKNISEIEKVLVKLEDLKKNLDKVSVLYDSLVEIEKYTNSIALHVMYIENVLGIANHDLSDITGVPNGKD